MELTRMGEFSRLPKKEASDIEEEIAHDAGAQTPQGLTKAELARLIRAAGFEPLERDNLYRTYEEEAPLVS